VGLTVDAKQSVGFVVTELKCENLVEPVAIDNGTPHFSWINVSSQPDEYQTAYEIEVATSLKRLQKSKADVWKSGKVESHESVMVPYAGASLPAQRQYVWRVRTWNRNGERSDWSQPARFGTGFLNPEDFDAKYIMSPDAHDLTPVLLKEVELKRVGEYAVMHVNSLGYHELYINGHKVGEHVLSPAVSQLDRCSQIVSYDVRPYLHKGHNDIVLWLGTGWYKKDIYHAAYDGPVVRAQLDICAKGKWSTVAKTDNSWCYNVSQIGAYRDLGSWNPMQFGGEMLDARRVLTSLDVKTLHASSWAPVKVVELEGMSCQQQMFPGNRIQPPLSPVMLKELGDKKLMIDFGRNLTGWFSAEFVGLNRGDSVYIEYSDDLDDDGSVKYLGDKDIYIASGTRGTFCNKFNHHSYRYAVLTGVTREQVKAQALPFTADEAGKATFSCSDSDINAVHDMISRTLDCLTFSGYMVDCPHLERQGYGGDGNSSTMTLQTMRNAVSTYYNWLQAWHDVQDADGSLPHVAPTCRRDGGGPYWCGFIIQAPWRTYLNYGDDRMLTKHYSDMQLWLEYVKKHSPDGLLKKWPETHNRTWYLGDWLAPKGINVTDDRSIDFVSNCFVSECLQSMTDIARHLGKKDDANVYAEQRQHLLKLLHEHFYHPEDSTYASASPLDLAYALNAGVVPAQLHQGVNEKLVSLSRDQYDCHIAVGLVGVAVFTEWAICNHAAQLMYDILKQPDYPGYLYMIHHGATSTWESWDRERSRIHNCYNGIGLWFYQALAGIRPDEAAPGYRHFFVEPQMPDGINWVKATKPTPYGEIAVSWQRNVNHVNLQLTVPVGTTATVKAGGKELTAGSGQHEYQFEVF